MLTPKQITLQEALQDAGMTDLPKEWTPESNSTWISAIVLCTKVGGQQEYVRCVNDGNGKPTVKKDYGRSAAILRYDRIFPTATLDKRFMPDLRSDKAIITFLDKAGYKPAVIEALLSKDGKTPEQAKADRNTVKEYVTKAAIKMAQKTLAEEQRCKNIYKPRNGKGQQEADA